MLVFNNPGEIDIRTLLLFGSSIKDNSNSIGRFGTGFKYAVAIILRLGGKITVYSGLDKYEFTKKEVALRNDVRKEIILMNGVEQNWTTDYGAHWEPWQACRELYCNAVDEGGQIIGSNIDYQEGTTNVVVRCEEVEIAWKDREKWLVRESQPILNLDNYVAIYSTNIFTPGIYNNGILVRAMDDTRFCYDITGHLSLSEDRTLSYTWGALGDISRALKECTLENFKTWVLGLVGEGNTLEEDIRFNIYELDQDKIDFVNQELSIGVKDKLPKSLVDYCASKTVSNVESFDLTYNQEAMVNRCLEHLNTIGYGLVKENIRYAYSLGGGILGHCDMNNGIITISAKAFRLGETALLGTFVEEAIHYHTAASDMTREFQNAAMDIIANLLLERG